MRIFELRKTKEELAAMKQAKREEEYRIYNSPEATAERARESLEVLKEIGIKISPPNDSYQLFVPRLIERFATKKERRNYVYSNPSQLQYGFDDEGNMKPSTEKWINDALEEGINGPPILSDVSSEPGYNKPSGTFWTSTGKKMPDGSWTSDWNKYLHHGGAGGIKQKFGFLYKVKPNTCVLELDSQNDCKRIYEIFADLGRANQAYEDSEEWKKIKSQGYGSPEDLLKRDFPWQEISKHFDAIHHYAFRSSYFNSSYDMLQGYDVESTAFFKTSRLELLGKVKLYQFDKEDDDEY